MGEVAQRAPLVPAVAGAVVVLQATSAADGVSAVCSSVSGGDAVATPPFKPAWDGMRLECRRGKSRAARGVACPDELPAAGHISLLLAPRTRA